jgi:hypothetical protein
MNILSLNNVESLSFDKTFNFLGDIFTYSSLDSYSIRSRVTGDYYLNNISVSWSGMENLIESGFSYLNFIIHGVDLGTGKIKSFNWEEGNDLQNKKFSMQFEILSSGNLYNLTGSNYTEIDKSIFSNDFKYVKSIDESFSISMDSNGTQNTSQEISLSIDSPLETAKKIQLKNKIFSGFSSYRLANIGIESIFPSIITGNYLSGYISYSNESCDTLNDEYSFSKKSYYDNNSFATWEYAHSLDFNGNNIVLSENGTLKSIFFSGNSEERNIEGARYRWNSVRTGIYQRASGSFSLLTGFQNVYSGNCNLIYPEISRNISEDPFDGTITYNYTYTNDATFLNSGYIFFNSRTSEKDQDGYFNITENGSYLGRSKKREKRFGLALTGYIDGVPNIYSRITGSFELSSKVNKFLCKPTGNFRLNNKSVSYKEFEGEVTYTNIYSNNPAYYPDNSNFIFSSNSITDSKPVHIYNKFLIPRYKEIVQSADQSSEGSFSNNIKIIGKPYLTINDYLNECFTKVKKPSGVDPDNMFLKNMNYSFDPFENTFNSNFDYYYTSGIDKNNILI